MPETKISCVIVDDEPLAVRLLEKYALTHSDVELKGCFTDAEAALEACLATPPDAVFLDINMPRVSGLDFGRDIDSGKTRIVFVTAYDNYALDGFRLNAADYLLKPVSYEEFSRAVDRVKLWKGSLQALKKLETEVNGNGREDTRQGPDPGEQTERYSDEGETTAGADPRFLTVRSEYRLIRIPLDDILFLEGLKDYIKIWRRSQDRPILTLASLKSLENRLPGEKFMRVHRSYIVNLDHVKSVRRNAIDFDKSRVPVSETFRKKFIMRLGL